MQPEYVQVSIIRGENQTVGMSVPNHAVRYRVQLQLLLVKNKFNI